MWQHHPGNAPRGRINGTWRHHTTGQWIGSDVGICDSARGNTAVTTGHYFRLVVENYLARMSARAILSASAMLLNVA